MSSDNPAELFDRVDEADHVIGTVRRGEAHGNPALIHRSVQLLIFDRRGRLLLQRRSASKDLFPGYYCASVAGHVAAGDDYAQTVRREAVEEVGVDLEPRWLDKTLVRSPAETEMAAMFIAQSEGPFRFDPVETEGGVWLAAAELEAALAAHMLRLTPALLAALAFLREHPTPLAPGWNMLTLGWPTYDE